MNLSFRKLLSSDIASCLDIVKQNYPSEKDKFWQNILPNDLSDILNKKYPSECLILTKDEITIGFGCYVEDKKQKNIYTLTWINILPAEQRKGIGKQLVSELEKDIKKNNRQQVHIVLETDKPDFYKKLNYITFHKNNKNDIMIKVL